MCGLLGKIDDKKVDNLLWRSACNIQNHRGPDSAGEWFGNLNNWHISLAHQRLSILDLSESGSQPMKSTSSGSVLIFNGEIYNYIELKKELETEGAIFSGSSDTEVLLKALDLWGIQKTLPKLNGMWSFVWLDIKDKLIYLTRDRTGEKPLYFSCSDNAISFASELKTLLTLEDRRTPLNYQKIYEFLKYGVLDNGTETIMEGIEQIRPGTYKTFELNSNKIIHNQMEH